MNLQSGVHQKVEAGEEVTVRGRGLQGSTGHTIDLPLDRSEDRAGLGHVQGLLLRVHGHGGGAGEGGAGGGHLAQLLGDVGGGDVEGGGGGGVGLALLAAATPGVILATPTRTRGAGAVHSTLSAVVSLLGLELQCRDNLLQSYVKQIHYNTLNEETLR